MEKIGFAALFADDAECHGLGSFRCVGGWVR
jgi:hypothetical protein